MPPHRAPQTPITSLQNPKVKAVAALQAEPRERRRQQLFCVENPREIERALDAGLRLRELYLEDPDAHPSLRAAADAQACPLYPVSRAVLEKMALRQHPTGALAVFEARTRALDDLRVHPHALFLVCSGLEKPGNVGAILRSADGAGVDGVLIDREDADVYAPQVVHASTGAVFHVPLVRASADDLLAWLRAHEVRVLALSPEGADLYAADHFARGPCALVLGAEAEGVAPAWREAASHTLAIPMRGRADSLNVSVTAAIVSFEARRQQRA